MNNLRYSRQIAIPEFGIKSQRKLSKSCAAVLGAGGIGSAAIAYLSAAGIGKLKIIEKDVLEETNLNRQIIYREKDIGLKKVQLAANYVKDLNRDVKVQYFNLRAGEKELVRIFKSCDLLIDCSDNFQTRFAVNSAAVSCGRPYIFSAVYRWESQIALIDPQKGPCLRCLFKGDQNDASSCADYGVIGPAAGMAGAMAALKAIEYLAGLKRESGKMFLLDFSAMSLHSIEMKKDKNCPACGLKRAKKVMDFSFLRGLKKIAFNLGGEDRVLPSEENCFNISLEELDLAIAHISKTAAISLYCPRKIKSSLALSRLKALGFKNVKLI